MHMVADSTLAYEVEASPLLRTKSGRTPGPTSPSWTKVRSFFKYSCCSPGHNFAKQCHLVSHALEGCMDVGCLASAGREPS